MQRLQVRTTARPGPGQIRNAMTIDVEDYFQVSAFAPHIARDSWDEHAIAASSATSSASSRCSTSATSRPRSSRWAGSPSAIRRWCARIVAGGHELASHGYGHLRASRPEPRRIPRRHHAQQGAAGRHRRPGRCSATARRASRSAHGNLWALDALREAGYRYSSSIYPIQHDHYGMPDAPRFAFYPNGADGLLEVPITTVRDDRTATCRPAAAATSACCRMRCRAG